MEDSAPSFSVGSDLFDQLAITIKDVDLGIGLLSQADDVLGIIEAISVRSK